MQYALFDGMERKFLLDALEFGVQFIICVFITSGRFSHSTCGGSGGEEQAVRKRILIISIFFIAKPQTPALLRRAFFLLTDI